MADSELEILIRTTADTGGGEEAKKIIADVKQETAKATTESVKGTEKNIAATGEWKKAIAMLGRQFGEIGHLAKFAFNLPLLGVAALSIGIKKLIDTTKAWQLAILEKAEITAAVWEDQRKRTLEAKEAADKYKAAVSEIAKVTDTLATAEAKEVKILDAILAARKGILEASKQAELGAAGGDKAKEAEINARYGAKQTEEEAAAEQMRIDVMKRNFEKAQQEAAVAMKAAEAAAKTRQKPTPGADEAVEAAARISVRKKEIIDLEAARDKATGPNTLAELKERAKGGDIASVMVYQQAVAASEAVEQAKREQARDEQRVADFQREDARRKAAPDKAVDEWKQKDADVQARKRAIDEAEAVQRVRRVQTRAEAAAAYAGTQPGGGDMLGAAAAADAAKAGQTLDAGQKALLQSVFRLLGGNAQNNQQIIEIIRQANDSVAQMKTALALEQQRAAGQRR